MLTGLQGSVVLIDISMKLRFFTSSLGTRRLPDRVAGLGRLHELSFQPSQLAPNGGPLWLAPFNRLSCVRSDSGQNGVDHVRQRIRRNVHSRNRLAVITLKRQSDEPLAANLVRSGTDPMREVAPLRHKLDDLGHQSSKRFRDCVHNVG